jgi:hypothetical protein
LASRLPLALNDRDLDLSELDQVISGYEHLHTAGLLNALTLSQPVNQLAAAVYDNVTQVLSTFGLRFFASN